MTETCPQQRFVKFADTGGSDLPLRLVSAGHLPRKNHIVRPVLNCWGLVCIFEGSGALEVGQKRIGVEAPCYFYVAPRRRHTYGPCSGMTWNERFVCFEGRRVSDWKRAGWLEAAGRPLPMRGRQAISTLHDALLDPTTGVHSRSSSRLGLVTEDMVLTLHEAGIANADSSSVLRAIAQEWSHNPVKASAAEAARRLGLSYSRFRQLFRQQIGVSPYEFIVRSRIDLACLRLSQGNESVKRTAYECGFDRVETFNRQFHRRTGCSPTGWVLRVGNG